MQDANIIHPINNNQTLSLPQTFETQNYKIIRYCDEKENFKIKMLVYTWRVLI